MSATRGLFNDHPLAPPRFDRPDVPENSSLRELPGGPVRPTPPKEFPYSQVIGSLLEQGRIREAQKLFDYAKNFVRDEKLQNALAPPRVKTSMRSDVDRSAEFRWLDRNGLRFRGRWVALLGEELVASAETLKELLARIQVISLTGRPLLHHID